MLVYSFVPQQRCTALPHHFHPVLSLHFPSQQCSPILVHTLVAAFWPTAASHNFGPHLCPTNLAHCFVPAFLSTALLQRFCSMRGWPYGNRKGLKPLDTLSKTKASRDLSPKAEKLSWGNVKRVRELSLTASASLHGPFRAQKGDCGSMQESIFPPLSTILVWSPKLLTSKSTIWSMGTPSSKHSQGVTAAPEPIHSLLQAHRKRLHAPSPEKRCRIDEHVPKLHVRPAPKQANRSIHLSKTKASRDLSPKAKKLS